MSFLFEQTERAMNFFIPSRTMLAANGRAAANQRPGGHIIVWLQQDI